MNSSDRKRYDKMNRLEKVIYLEEKIKDYQDLIEKTKDILKRDEQSYKVGFYYCRHYIKRSKSNIERYEKSLNELEWECKNASVEYSIYGIYGIYGVKV